ncbi:MAG: aldo/keto reductase [Gammaproteobacteria bacterium]|nr:aldo/keto reductase [Gammaproteobacteria bacterium]
MVGTTLALQHRPLGNTGINVAAVSLGTVKFGRDQGVKYPVKIPDDKQALTLLATALGLGINLLDTAPAYGESERRLGQLISDQRDQWVLCTKVGEEFDGKQAQYDFSPEHCRRSVMRSLKRLNTDRLDIVLIHSNGDDLDILQRQGTLQVLQDLKAEGKILAAGISHKTVAGAHEAIKQGADVLMATLNSQYTDEVDLIAKAAQQGVGVLIKKALASGQATAQGLAFVAQRSGVSSIVVGTTNVAHLQQNVAVVAQAIDR